METKNFLFLVLTLSLILSGCQSMQRREAPQPPSPQRQANQPPPAPVPGAPAAEVKSTPGRAMPVGVYLGPGAMRAYAHVGVLRALQKAKIPIVAIGGLEWGSVVAASHALSRGANEVEWQMMKLRKDQIPEQGLLNRSPEPKDTAELFNFLRFVFADRDLDHGTIPFSCPAYDGEQTTFIEHGKARDGLLKCTVLPPLYNFYAQDGRQWISGAVSPGDWQGELKKAGAQYIIYVDVLSRGRALSSSQYSSAHQLKALWSAIRGISKQQQLFAHAVIEVPMDMDLGDYDKRRDAIAAGERAANTSINDILKAIGLTE
jgi:NTE family protein